MLIETTVWVCFADNQDIVPVILLINWRCSAYYLQISMLLFVDTLTNSSCCESSMGIMDSNNWKLLNKVAITEFIHWMTFLVSAILILIPHCLILIGWLFLRSVKTAFSGHNMTINKAYKWTPKSAVQGNWTKFNGYSALLSIHSTWTNSSA